MDRGRLEAFSDGVFAIVITVMVLGLRPPAGTDWAALTEVRGPFLAYVLSFVYLGIYWNNHHHLLKHLLRVTGSIMWANLVLLFWLTLFPFVTEWWGQQPTATVPTVVYGLVLLIAGVAYYLLQTLILRQHGGADSPLGRALGRDWKGRLSPVIYGVAVLLAWVDPRLSAILYVTVALIWLIPDRRLVRAIAEASGRDGS